MTAATTGYRVLPDWEQLPTQILHRDVSDVAVDSHDRVYLLTRSDAQVVVYERDGTFVGTWGRGVLSEHPHGITIAPDDIVYIVDEGRHCVESYSTDGQFIARIGPAEQVSDTGADASLPEFYARTESIRRSAGPYNRPTKLAVAANGDFYVTDGYGNARVHHFDPAGTLLNSWGAPGAGPGEFHVPHSLAITPDGRLFVCDRENDRIQIFDRTGEFLASWDDFQRPAGIDIRDGSIYVAELPWKVGHRTWRHGVVETRRPGRIRVFDLEGRELARFGGEDPCAVGGFAAPHGICVDSKGDIYLAQVTWTSGAKTGLYPADCPTFAKLTRPN